MAQTTLFSKSGTTSGSAAQSSESAAPSKYDAQGLYSDIRKQFPTGLAKTARIIITVKKIGGADSD